VGALFKGARSIHIELGYAVFAGSLTRLLRSMRCLRELGYKAVIRLRVSVR
jgi:hypothetical protein